MATPRALFHALDLLSQPGLVAVMRDQPLPDGVDVLIRIAAGDESSEQEAATLTAEGPARVREAAILYLQQVFLAPEADAYRVLGVEFDAPQDRLRENLGWLMKWLHPDRTRSDWDSAFAERVLRAWDLVKTRERRADYDQTLNFPGPRRFASVPAPRPRIHRPRHRIPWIRRSPGRSSGPHRRWQWLAAAVLAAAVMISTWLVPDWSLSRFLQAKGGLESTTTLVQTSARNAQADGRTAPPGDR